MSVSKDNIIKLACFLICAALLTGLMLFVLTQKDRTGGAYSDVDLVFVACQEADSIIISSGDKAILIDAGEKKHGDQILNALSKLGISKLEYMILTHPDKDHIGSAEKILNSLTVENIIEGSYEKGSELQRDLNKAVEKAGIPVSVPTEPMTIELNDAHIVVYPPETAQNESSNDSSLAVYIEHGSNTMLLAGDAEEARLRELMTLPIDKLSLYKVPHHGRSNPLSDEAIMRFAPQYAVVTAPSAERKVEEALKLAGTEVFFSDDKNVLAFSDGNNMTIIYDKEE